MVFADSKTISFPQFEVIRKKFDENLRLNIDQFIKTKMSISYINDQCLRDSLSLLYPINPQKPFFTSLNFKAIEKYQMSSMVQKVSIFKARLLGLDSAMFTVSDLMFKIFKFFEPLILQRFYKKKDISIEEQIKSLQILFPPDRLDDIVKVLFYKKFDGNAMLHSLENSVNSLTLSEPSHEYVQNINNLTLPGSKIKKAETQVKQVKVPSYFEDLLDYLRKCFTPQSISINLISQTKIHNSQNYFIAAMKHINKEIENEEKQDITQSTKIKEEIDENLTIEGNPDKDIQLNLEEIISKGWLNCKDTIPNIEIIFQSKNPLKFILSDIRKKERQTDNKMNEEVNQNLISVSDCLKGFFHPNKLELNCSKCEKGKHVETQYQLSESSPYLIIHFKRFMPRFTANGYEFIKNEERIVVDQKLSIGDKVFELEGIVNHFGKIDSGHYSYDRLMPASNSGSSQIRVLEYDDHKLKVHRYQKSRLESKDAYVVLYKFVSGGTVNQNNSEGDQTKSISSDS